MRHALCIACDAIVVDGGCRCTEPTYFTSGQWTGEGRTRRPVRTNAQQIASEGGRPFVDYTQPTVRYAGVFPGRVDPLDDPRVRESYLAERRTEGTDRAFRRAVGLPRAA